MRHVHLLIKPASGLCNLNCLYCFYHDIVEKREQASYGLMTEDTLAAGAGKGPGRRQPQLHHCLSRGRAHLGGAGFFPQGGGAAAAAQREPGAGVQLHPDKRAAVDSQWAAFFRENHFLVGLSLDGMKDTHDLYRLDAQGQGTFNRAARVLQLLKATGLRTIF